MTDEINDIINHYRPSREIELERAQRNYLEWMGQFGETLMRLHTLGFRGYIIKDNAVIETIIDPIYQKEIDRIHEYIKDGAKKFGL